MNMLNKFTLTVAVLVVCAVSTEAQARRYSRSNRGYSNNTVPNNTVQVTPQPQTVYKPVVTSPAPVVPQTKAIPVSTSAVKTPVAKPEQTLSGFEAEVVAQTNAQRARYGLHPLAIDPNLLGSARQHCQWMASAHSMTHTSAGVAENIAMGQSSPAEALNSWMNSSGHRANILGGGYSTIGVAAFTSSSGQVYWCQQFR